MAVNERETTKQGEQRIAPEQALYARVLEWSMNGALGLVLAGFIVYMLELLPARLPASELPHYWSLSLPEFLLRTGAVRGWQWLAELRSGDYLVLGSMAVLTAVPLVCLVAVAPAYARGRDWAYFGVTMALIAVLVLAASGVFGAH